MELEPKKKIMWGIAITVVISLVIIVILMLRDKDCEKYYVKVLVGERLVKENDQKNLPRPIISFISDNDKCSECFFIANTLYLTYYYNDTSVEQSIYLYAQPKKETEKSRDLPEIDFSQLNNKLNDKFFTERELEAEYFRTRVREYINENQIKDILVFSEDQADSVCKIRIDNHEYSVITSIDTLIVRKCELLQKAKAMRVSSRILLIYDPICHDVIKGESDSIQQQDTAREMESLKLKPKIGLLFDEKTGFLSAIVSGSNGPFEYICEVSSDASFNNQIWGFPTRTRQFGIDQKDVENLYTLPVHVSDFYFRYKVMISGKPYHSGVRGPYGVVCKPGGKSCSLVKLN